MIKTLWLQGRPRVSYRGHPQSGLGLRVSSLPTTPCTGQRYSYWIIAPSPYSRVNGYMPIRRAFSNADLTARFHLGARVTSVAQDPPEQWLPLGSPRVASVRVAPLDAAALVLDDELGPFPLRLGSSGTLRA